MTTPTPNPVLVAAAPVLENVISELQTFFTTVLTGDPSQIALRFAAASQVLLGSIELQLPGLATAEIGVVHTAIDAKLAGWKTSLSTLVAAAPPPSA
jgi:hypothetical protein